MFHAQTNNFKLLGPLYMIVSSLTTYHSSEHLHCVDGDISNKSEDDPSFFVQSGVELPASMLLVGLTVTFFCSYLLHMVVSEAFIFDRSDNICKGFPIA